VTRFNLFPALTLGVWLLCSCDVFAEQWFLSGGHAGLGAQKERRSIKISITPDGKQIRLNGSATTVERLNSTLQEFAKQRDGIIWYNQSVPGLKPSDAEPLTTTILCYLNGKTNPGGARVLNTAADNHILVYFCQRSDFVGGNVREVQNFDDVVIASRNPEYPSDFKQHGIGGAGSFLQHINRETGDVMSVTIKKSTGRTLLDRRTVDALRQWKYKAPTKFETVAILVTFIPDRSTIKK
jgi:TonB family protein